MSNNSIGKIDEFLQAQDPKPYAGNVICMPHDELVQHALTLESRLSEATLKIRDLEAQLAKRMKASNTVESTIPDSNVLTDAQVQEKASKLTDIAQREIKKQMKWVPSCKRGSAKWSYTATVPSEAIFHAMFNLNADHKGKKWKQKKLPGADLGKAIGDIEAKIRYGYVDSRAPPLNPRRWSAANNNEIPPSHRNGGDIEVE